MWVLLGLASMAGLGVYDIFKKHALEGNPVLPVLFLSTATSAALFLPLVGLSLAWEGMSEALPALSVPLGGLAFHGHILLKSAIVTASWVLAFAGLKRLPISVAAPVRATGPLWTLFGAILLYGERLSPLQWAGMAVTLGSFWLFSLQGKKEGIRFLTDRWVWAVFAATLIGTFSTLYDKYLVGRYEPLAVQAWFCLYQAPVVGAVAAAFWLPGRGTSEPFRWTASIPLIGLALVLADAAYFYALSMDGALVSALSLLRRSSVAVSFGVGGLLFGERNLRGKAWPLAGILAGVALLVLGS